jgi:hypothetical protein
VRVRVPVTEVEAVRVRVPVAEVEVVRVEVGEMVGVWDIVLLPVFVAL